MLILGRVQCIKSGINFFLYIISTIGRKYENILTCINFTNSTPFFKPSFKSSLSCKHEALKVMASESDRPFQKFMIDKLELWRESLLQELYGDCFLVTAESIMSD